MNAEWPYGEFVAQVGWWYTVCCEQSLYQIETAEELAEVRDEFEDDREEGWLGNWWHFWPTREAALADPFIRDVAHIGSLAINPSSVSEAARKLGEALG